MSLSLGFSSFSSRTTQNDIDKNINLAEVSADKSIIKIGNNKAIKFFPTPLLDSYYSVTVAQPALTHDVWIIEVEGKLLENFCAGEKVPTGRYYNKDREGEIPEEEIEKVIIHLAQCCALKKNMDKIANDRKLAAQPLELTHNSSLE